MSTITVAICARNAQNIIGRCLDAIRNQTVPPDEILVAVDDLSDPTAAVAATYGARVVAGNATGLYEARNAALAACTTDYLAFTDADCVLAPDWVKCAKIVLDSRPEVAAGTGRHPAVGEKTLASWLHHMWFLVETRRTGETDGVIGGNSYFRTQALRDVGGWLKLPRHSAAEDVYISKVLRDAGHKIWFQEECAARHHYETHMYSLWRKSVMMGKDIVVMMRVAAWRGALWWYTMAIPILAGVFIAGVLSMFQNPPLGAAVAAVPLIATFLFLLMRFKSLSTTTTRWAARWFLIWPYSWGILKGLCQRLPAKDHKR